jgi:hypothetical protein
MRYEFFGGIGASGFLGDLGGADQIGTHYIRDINFSMTRPAFTFGGRYFILKRLAVQSALSYAWIRADDRLTTEPFRHNRNMQVLTPLAEWQCRIEYTVLTEKQGHRYNIKNVRGIIGNHVIVDIFGGGALFFFYPMGRDSRPGGTGKYYGLHSVGTEGENTTSLYPTKHPYNLFSFSIPLGIQLKWVINRKWSVSWELGMRQTFTDYIDDVSKAYVDPSLVAQYNKNKNVDAALASYFADPSLGRANNIDPNAPGHPVPNKNTTLNGQQRGNNRNYDTYFLSFFTLNYKVRTGRNGLPIFR